jgi:2'-5' RNA ligase
MGCIERRDLDAIWGVLTHLAEERAVRHLTATEIQISANARGEAISLLEIENSEELRTLHERVMDEMKRFFNHEVTTAVFYDEAVADTTREWVRTYPQKAAYEQFRPHITLGYGRTAAALPLPLVFPVARLALCHLGNHATCRKVLAAVDLPGD